MTCHEKNNAACELCGTLSLIILLMAFAATAQERLNEGVRSGGMGGAYMGISDDANGIPFNPSGLVYSPQGWLFEFGAENVFSSGLPFGNDLRNDGSITFSSLGVVYNRLEKPNRTVPIIAMASKGSALPLDKNHKSMPSSNVFSAGGMVNYLNAGFLNQMALRIFLSKGFIEKEPLPHSNHRLHRLALSVTGKIWGYYYDSNIADNAQVNTEAEREAIRDFFSQNDRSKHGFGFDFSASYAPHPCARIGLAWINVKPPDLGLASASRFPRSLRGGVAVLVKPAWRWLVAADLEKQENFKDLKFYIGSESRVPKLRSDALKLRFGANRNWFSAGFKLAVFSFDVNYAVAFFLHDEGLYNHRFSLSYSRRPPMSLVGSY